MSSEVIGIIDQLCREKGIDKEILIDALKSAMEAAARKRLETEKPLHTEFNEDTGEVEVFSEKTVVDEVTDDDEEISLKAALKMNPEVVLGEQILVHLPLEDFGRIAAQLAKQVIMQKVREAEIDLICKEFEDKKGELINGIVQRFEHGDIIVDLGKAEGILPRREQVFRESFSRGDRIRAYILDIRKTARNATVILSRTHTGLIKNLFELEVPEISEGMVDIMGIVREPNGRTKIAVKTNDRDVDAVGACVGMRGMRVQAIVQELRGEKIDIVEYSEDPETFIRNALSPAKISRIIRSEEENHMTIIVADDQMSLAIGKKGQNVRLAAKLVKLKIDIQGQSESGDLLDPSGLLSRKKEAVSQVNFLEEVKSAKGLGGKITAILFEGNVVTFENVVEKGIKGLIELPGIGPKKAEAILKFAQDHMEEAAAIESAKAEKQKEAEAEEELKEAAEETTPAEEDEESDEEEQEIPVEELSGTDPEIIKCLVKNGFQTLAELSVTPKEELIEIEGIDDKTAESVIDQAKKRMENMESV
ncbi:transcription termination factor NusA [Candidatus Nitromaritima sp. SCGC AAA799-C22]|nr:transcription termination factor NusA [Candidatus Nitromaritima sp. SCGC AAA799-C22]